MQENPIIYRSKIGRIMDYDVEIVEVGPTGYARTVKPVERQPVVMSQAEFDQMIVKMHKKIIFLEQAVKDSENGAQQYFLLLEGHQELAKILSGDNKADFRKAKMHDIRLALNTVKSILNYRGNCYLGCTAFCQNCQEILGPLGIQEHQQLNHVIFHQDPVYPYIGFAKSRNQNGLSKPMLFAQRAQAYREARVEEAGATLQTLEKREKQIPEVCWILCRSRLVEICMALQALGLSAWEILAIVDHTIESFELVPMHKKWAAIVKVKHYKST